MNYSTKALPLGLPRRLKSSVTPFSCLPQADPDIANADRPATVDERVDDEGRCVLVVEDNISVGQFATQLLDDLGYRTAWVVSAEEALEGLGADGDGNVAANNRARRTVRTWIHGNGQPS